VDKTTRKVLIVVFSLFGLIFLALGAVELAVRHSYFLGALHVALGLMWLIGATLVHRRAPRV
jgi:hypothetical protein